MLPFVAASLLLAIAAAPPVNAQLSTATEAQIATAAEKVLHDTGVPSASVGIVQNGRIVYTHAFGLARLEPPKPAKADMAYPIGSISKQFTAAAMLLLQQQGKLSLNDPVSKYFPELTRASEVKIINLLTHTSGYQDYAPQDYTIPAWELPGDPLKLVHEFAGKPLDFEPGTQWQYSNTNYVLAALIIQKVSGVPFADFLRDRVLQPAGLDHVLNLNTEQSRLQVTGYMSYALAPLRPALLEAPGWYFGDADLAMPVASLLTWDLTIINHSLLSEASYTQMETPFLLKNGKDSGYGLGVDVGRTRAGYRVVEHSGEVGGFVAENIVFPDDNVAIAVLTNEEASGAASDIAQAISPIVLSAPTQVAAGPDVLAPKLRSILTGLQQGRIDRSLFTMECNAYFDQNGLADFKSSLAPLGAIGSVMRARTAMRGGMTFDAYHVSFANGTTLVVTLYLMPDGRIEQLLVEGKA
jgi:CubicO group peptidase (beta-lactamase class C family)